MDNNQHRFNEYVLDPIPAAHWRNGEPIPDTKIGFCETCGFYHVTPYPSAEYLSGYYQHYEMPTAQENLAELARFLARNVGPDEKIVDMGCGDGAFLKELHSLGYKNLHGFDQSPGLERAKKLGFGNFHNASVWDYLAQQKDAGGADARVLVMVNVLEHVTEPLDLLRQIWEILPPDGLLCLVVPNDFSPLQQAFLKAKQHRPWFICLPDHVNYFSFATLELALAKSGFAVSAKTALFPLEMLLLQDLDYIETPSLGPVAHNRRVMFEKNIKAAGMPEVLDQFYSTLANGGHGREIIMLARKVASSDA